HRHRGDAHPLQRGEDADGDLSPVGDEHLPEQSRHVGAVTVTRMGVGLKPLQGLLICGQLEIATSTSISARRSRYFPGAEIPSTIPSVPSASTGTFMNQLMLETRSRLPRP